MDQTYREASPAIQLRLIRALAPPWVAIVAPGITITSLGILAFIFLAEIIYRLHIAGELRDLVLFVVGSLLLAPICAALQVFISRLSRHDVIEATNTWIAIAALSVMAVLPFAVPPFGGGENAFFSGARIVTTAACAALIFSTMLSATLRAPIPALERFRPGRATASVFVVSLSIALFSLFWVEPEATFINPIVSFFSAPPFAATNPTFTLRSALIAAALAILSIAALTVLEIRLRGRAVPYSRAIYQASLVITIGLTFLCFFDFSLPADALHNMTNIGPALHLRFGGVLMVDTFSQYGSGPVLMTLLGLKLGPTTIPMGVIVVQIHNMLFYGLWLICLYRMSTLKLPALLIGFLSIGVLMAVWGEGASNINFAPSIMGLRYLPVLLMVLSISLLPYPTRHSVLTVASTFIAGLWSSEALVGALAIHVAFLGMLGLRDRSIFRVLADGVLACLPVLASIVALSTFTLLQAGMLPHYRIYLDFMSVYSMLSSFWSLPANPLFLGWIAVLLAVFLVLADGWTRIFDPTAQVTELTVVALYYKFVPMALLAILMSAYFVGRSVEYILVVALLPFVALVFPALLRLAIVLSRNQTISLLALTLPVLAGLWALSFTLLALTRSDAPYSFLLQECRDHGRCAPPAILAGLREKLLVRPVIDKNTAQWSRYHFDETGTVREAVDALTRFAPDQQTVSVFLGSVYPDPLVGTIRDCMASDMALLYAGKWHRWPRSYGLSDELIPTLVDQVVSTPIHLNEGELVVIRRNETTFCEIEKRVLQKIRAENTLCALPEQWKEITAYRIAGKAGCPVR
jgi:hypothetical protein